MLAFPTEFTDFVLNPMHYDQLLDLMWTRNSSGKNVRSFIELLIENKQQNCTRFEALSDKTQAIVTALGAAYLDAVRECNWELPSWHYRNPLVPDTPWPNKPFEVT